MGWRVDDDMQKMLRDSARGYLGDAGGPAHFRTVRSSPSGFDAAAWAQMGELGWTGLLLPESVGGSGLGLELALVLADELGQAIAPEPFIAAAVIAATVLAAGQGMVAVELGSALAQGSRTVTLAWQEQRASLGVPEFATQLAGGALHGRKIYVPGWHDGTALLVAAATVDGPVVVRVDPQGPGVSVTSARATDGTFVADISFDGAAVNGEDVIVAGAAARSAIDLAVARGTVALSAQLEGLAGALWRITLEYMRQREQFGSNLSDFQALRHQMVDLYSGIELAAASWRRAAEASERGNNFGVELHAAKARCSQVAQDMSRWAIQYHGAFGFTDDADVGLYVHAALRFSSWLGNAAAHRRAVLRAHRDREKHNG